MGTGFLGYRASLMMDVVVCALVVVVPLLIASLYAVKVQRNFTLHRNLQLFLCGALFVVVLLFEVDMRLSGGITGLLKNRTTPLTEDQYSFFRNVLIVHLFFSISTVVLWAVTLILAWKRFSNPPLPGEHSRLHKTLGWLSSIDLTLTSVTGLAVYYYGFIV
jgi:uncharacterized membrane protein YozB (DUF420 family)